MDSSTNVLKVARLTSRRALTMWYTDKGEWAELTRRIMEQDW